MFADWKDFCQARITVPKSHAILSPPRRRPKQGGYARGDETRAKIISAALHVFGERGFDQAATRDIAARAGVNPPALQYYFGSKDGLHRACAQRIIDQASPRLDPVIVRAKAAANAGEPAGALEALEGALDAIVDSLADPDTEIWSRFITRGKQDGAGPGMEMIRVRLRIPMIEAVAGLVATLTGVAAASEITRLRTVLILGQVHWIQGSRGEALKVLCWPRFDAEKMGMIKRTLHEHTRLVLETLRRARF